MPWDDGAHASVFSNLFSLQFPLWLSMFVITIFVEFAVTSSHGIPIAVMDFVAVHQVRALDTLHCHGTRNF